MILEALVTTVDARGAVNIAPVGPRVNSDLIPAQLRLFPGSRTYRNLLDHSEGTLHVSDDVLLLAQAAIGDVDPMPPLVPARVVRGWTLRDACRVFEFRVRARDDREERVRFDLDIVHCESRLEFFGFNRARNAVLEAAILATRLDLLPRDHVVAEFARLAPVIDKTGGPREHEAFQLLRNHFQTRVGL